MWEGRIPHFLSATRLSSVWDRLRTSFWFLPASMALVAILLSFALVQLDTWLGVEVVRELGWLYTFGPEGARAILSAIASSMITVAGLTFSITMLTLQLASSQFGPRVLRNFMRDRGNQVVLGTFIATFVYCLLVLRTVRGTEESSFVPHLSVAFGVLLAIASIAVLIYFIHHVATSIRIETMLSNLAAEAREAIDRLYPAEIGRSASRESRAEPDPPSGGDHIACSVQASASGYVQRVDEDALMEVACEYDLLIRVDARPGRFVSEGDTLLSALPSGRAADAAAQLTRTFVLGSERTPRQDVEFSIRRIVEIAQRALSPGVNDPTTALYCIDRLGEAFGRLAERSIPSSSRSDESGCVRVVTEVSALEDLACPAFAAVARYGLVDADVVCRLLDVMDVLCGKAEPGAANAIARLAHEIRRQAQQEVQLRFDKARLEAAGAPSDGRF